MRKTSLWLLLLALEMIIVGCRKPGEGASMPHPDVTKIWTDETFQLNGGFSARNLTTQSVDTLLIPFHPTPAERATILDEHFSQRKEFYANLRKALGEERYADFLRATYPGRYAVSEIVRVYGLKESTADEVYELLQRMQETPDIRKPERSFEFAQEIRKLFPNVPGDVIVNLDVIPFSGLAPGTLYAVYAKAGELGSKNMSQKKDGATAGANQN